MTMKNKYAIRARISEHQFRQIVRLFSLDLDATQITAITGLNRNTINRYLRGIRVRITEYCEAQSPFSGEIEVDESYFGARRVKGKRGRGARQGQARARGVQQELPGVANGNASRASRPRRLNGSRTHRKRPRAVIMPDI
jgi:hypothetical protein